MSSEKRRLTTEDWAEVRRKWEQDPRDGYLWIVREMNLPVGDKAVRKHALKENWAKKISLKTIVERAQEKADAKLKSNSGSDSVTSNGTQVTADESTDLRAELIARHRSDWQEHREKFPLDAVVAMEEGRPETAVIKPNAERFMRVAKAAAETIRLRQQGEREAWGLDAVANETNAGMATLDELNAMFEVGVKKALEMRDEVRKQRGAVAGNDAAD